MTQPEVALKLAKEIMSRQTTWYEGKELRPIEVLAQTVIEMDAEIKNFKDGIQNFRCPHCKEIAGPFYPVNLVHELKQQSEALREAYSHISNYAQLLREAKDMARYLAEMRNDYATEWLAKYSQLCGEEE